jgi:PHB de-polymerase C-terminus
MRDHYVQPEVGHYGIFSGSRFRREIVPRIGEFILKAEAASPAVRSQTGTRSGDVEFSPTNGITFNPPAADALASVCKAAIRTEATNATVIILAASHVCR